MEENIETCSVVVITDVDKSQAKRLDKEVQSENLPLMGGLTAPFAGTAEPVPLADLRRSAVKRFSRTRFMNLSMVLWNMFRFDTRIGDVVEELEPLAGSDFDSTEMTNDPEN